MELGHHLALGDDGVGGDQARGLLEVGGGEDEEAAPAVLAVERTGEERCTLPAAPGVPLEDHVWKRVNEMLRCQIFARAIAIRAQLSSESYWGTFFGVESPAYETTAGGRSCVEGG